MTTKINLCSLIYLSVFSIILVNAGVSNFGDKCEHTAECTDHRMVCKFISNTNHFKTCVCDRFHRWEGPTFGCVQNYTIDEILGLMDERYNVSSHIQREADFIFYAQILAGIFVMAVGFTCTIIILIYCYYMKTKDKSLKESVAHLKKINDERKSKQTPSTSVRLTYH